MMENKSLELFQQYRNAYDYQLIVSFKGRLSQEVLTEFGSMIRTSLSTESKIKKIFAVFIELAQNMLHYSAERKTLEDGRESGVGIIMVDEKSIGYNISAGNLVLNEKIELLKSNCEKINSMSKDELKAYYQRQLRSNRPEESKGAGVGLIDIARKSDGPLSYDISPVDDKHSFFTLSVYFTKEN
ncbi:SiaB family protein kinase [Leptospira santarosai]|uniref:SiaB family protein kinase n=1 Tax=Leptospira santarosai TaxID=28183 RepID=UPI0024AEEA2B|nr:SiaB family protein kinase [Leptospira santarosai]MDI7222703.1 SiaB family protein kinase [Leptospira santarosai]